MPTDILSVTKALVFDALKRNWTVLSRSLIHFVFKIFMLSLLLVTFCCAHFNLCICSGTHVFRKDPRKALLARVNSACVYEVSEEGALAREICLRDPVSQWNWPSRNWNAFPAPMSHYSWHPRVHCWHSSWVDA